MKDKVCNINMKNIPLEFIEREVLKFWGDYDIFNICNVSCENFKGLYERLACSLGHIRECHPVNDKSTKFSNSRDIKYNPNIPHFFASNTRQPLHTDYAYYEESEAPEWLMLYCLVPSEFGGVTDIISLDTLKKVMSKYNPDLLDKIKIDVNWKYNGIDGDKIHKKPILKDNKINWNYWQIKKDINNEETIAIAEEFFQFLENVVVQGRIFDFSKHWKPGDCIIFKDTSNLHGRSAFLGERWLKDHAFFEKNRKV